MYQNIIRPFFKNFIKVYLRDCWWSLYGKKFKNPDIFGPINSILYICKGNICRSTFAEHISRKIVNNDHMLFASAGLQVNQSTPSPEQAILTGRKFDIDLEKHFSKPVDQKMMQSYDLVLTMEARQLQNLQKIFPEYKAKIHLLPLYESIKRKGYKGYYRYNIGDPYGKGEEEFDDCFFRIKQCVYNVLYKNAC